MPETFRYPVRVRYVECDMQGHVFFGHYMTWLDMAHTALLEETTGRRYSELVESGVDVVVAESGLRYRSPAHFDDELEIVGAFDSPTTSSLTTHFTITRGDDVIATGFLRHICVDPATMQKQPWPDAVRTAFEARAVPAA
jgi:acyl-CoA thioester hydrolase